MFEIPKAFKITARGYVRDGPEALLKIHLNGSLFNCDFNDSYLADVLLRVRQQFLELRQGLTLDDQRRLLLVARAHIANLDLIADCRDSNLVFNYA